MTTFKKKLKVWLEEGTLCAQLFRLKNPVGAVLLFLPCVWGLLLASSGKILWFEIILFAVGAFLARSVGCAYNDWVDTDIDKKVERTKTRPLAAGKLPVLHAIFASLALVALSFLILFQLSPLAIYTGFLLAFATLFYPWLKRFTHWPQLYLGFLFTGGVWVAWFHLHDGFEDLTLSPLLLYTAGVLWTLYYDTIYAYQDWQDDKKIGVKSTALLWQKKPKPFLMCLVALMGTLFCWLGVYENLTGAYYACIGLSLLWFLYQVKRFKRDDKHMARNLFLENQGIGFLLALALYAGFIARPF